MAVPFVDLHFQHAPISKELQEAFARVLEDGRYILGPDVERFEAAYAKYHGSPNAVGVANGLEALGLTLRAMGIGPGDEVITTSHTFIASVLGIVQSGATPVLVDCIEPTLAMDPEQVERAITPKTKAIVAVHLYGRIIDMEPYLDIASRHGLRLIEDAAQAHGAVLRGKRAGTFAEAACFSFYPSKNLGALGDAGAVITRDDEVARRVRLFRNYGSIEKYRHEVVGGNSRLDTLQAAILNVKLPYLDEWNRQRQEAAHYYQRALTGWMNVPALPRPEGHGLDHVYHLFIVRVKERERVQIALAQKGIQTGIHYPAPVHRQEAYRELGLPPLSLPICERVSEETLSLPMFVGITRQQQDAVIQALREAM